MAYVLVTTEDSEPAKVLGPYNTWDEAHTRGKELIKILRDGLDKPKRFSLDVEEMVITDLDGLEAFAIKIFEIEGV